MDTLILGVGDIRCIVGHVGLDNLIDEVVTALERVCVDYDEGEFEIPSRTGIHNGDGGILEWMPVMHRQSTSIKLVGYHPANPRKFGLPTILSVGLTFDATNGHLQTLADATFATALRTGAASAVASRVLAMTDSRVLGLVGGGAQAVSQVHAISRSFDLQRVLVYDTNPAVSASFDRRIATLGLDELQVEVVGLDELTEQADIICTATSVAVGDGPVLSDGNLQRHVHLNAVGSDLPGKIELPLSLLRRSFVVADFVPQAQREGECQQLLPHEIGTDLVQLVQGSSQFAAKRTEATVFDSTGFALEDFVVLDVLHVHARELGIGSRVQIESMGDPTNPYAFLFQELSNGVAG